MTMRNFKQKARLLFLPIILVNCSTALACSLLYYYLCIVNVPLFTQAVHEALIPAIVSVIAVVCFVRPKLKLLEYKNIAAAVAVNLLCVLFMWIPTIAAIKFTTAVTAAPTTVSTVNEITANDSQRFYRITHFDIDTEKLGQSFSIDRQSSKSSTYHTFNLSLAAPLMAKNISGKKILTYWLCKSYYEKTTAKTINKTDVERFIEKSKAEFLNSAMLRNTDHFVKVPYPWQDSEQLDAIHDIMYRHKQAYYIILEPEKRTISEIRANAVLWLIIAFKGSSVFLLLIILILPFAKVTRKKN